MKEYIVYIDLEENKITHREITNDIRKKYIGAIGINAMLLMESDAFKYDPLSENNVLILGVGPIVGTGIMAGNRCVVTTRSPITYIYGDSNIGGNFPVKMKALGISHLVIRQKAEWELVVSWEVRC